jgi:hypothetical protein
MTRSSSVISVWSAATFACVLSASGCPKDDVAASGSGAREDGGSSGPTGAGGHAQDGSGGHAQNGSGGATGKQDAGSHGAHDAGTSGGGVLDAGGANGGKLDSGSASGGASDAGSANGGKLAWYQTCGAPVCRGGDQPYDDPNVPNCSKDQSEGAACSMKDQRCDGVAGCGAMLVCSDSDPKLGPGGCPISRARYKQDIEYLDARQLREYHAQLMNMPLASYRYKNAPDAPQLGFIIDDVEPSVAVAGDGVNMYGYLSMAVAAIQVQAKQIETLQRELADLRSQTAREAPATCTQP